eukprot:m.637240 g.637240  ORF g.637240 m.637240 type:complete len:58 (+) comp22600_c1_seq12:172-345(+)
MTTHGRCARQVLGDSDFVSATPIEATPVTSQHPSRSASDDDGADGNSEESFEDASSS